MPSKPRPKWLPYVTALVATVIAAALAPALAWLFSPAVLFAVFFAAVALAGWHGGFWPAIVAALFSYLITNLVFLRPEDTWRFTSITFAYIFVCVCIAVFSEVSKRSLRRAKTNAEQVKLIAESIADGFVAVDNGWRLTYMNRAAEVINRRYGDGKLAKAEDCFPLNLDTASKERLQCAAKDRVTVDFEEFYFPWKRWFEIQASPTDTGGLSIYFRDITERKAAEVELRKLASIIESSEDAVIGIDLDGYITNWNAAAEKLYEYTAEEVLGQSFAILSSVDQSDAQSEMLAKIRRGESIRHFDTVQIARGGRRINVSLSVSPIKDASGKIVGASKIARDITTRKRAEEALLEADRRKDEFLALLGHELRNPLAGIVNGVQVLHMIGSTEPEAVEVQGIIERQAGHMTRLIDDLLDVSRIARGKITLQTERIDLAALARRTAEDHRALLRDNGLSLDLEMSGEALWIDGDSVRLAQVISNLLNNAVKFTDPGGAIRIRVAADSGPQHATIEVRDSGMGMTPETIALLFEPFAQAEAALARSRGGLGLGLAVVKGLVQLHHGTVEATSAGPGHGSTFTVRLPLQPEPRFAEPEPEDETASESLRVLLIDDNPDALVPMSKLLRINGHKIAVASDGPGGLTMAREFNPDVVLCDIGLPGDVNGYGVARAMRSDPGLRSAYLVAVTGYGQEEDRRRAAEAGFDQHVTKPVDWLDLAALLTHASGSRHHAARSIAS